MTDMLPCINLVWCVVFLIINYCVTHDLEIEHLLRKEVPLIFKKFPVALNGFIQVHAVPNSFLKCTLQGRCLLEARVHPEFVKDIAV